MSKRLAAKAGLIQLPGIAPTEPVAAPAPEVHEPKAKTAPGAMMQFLSSQSEAIKEVGALREQIKRYEGSSPVLELDPKRVHPSRWANRHVSSFDGGDFAQFKDEIASAGGNVQPVRVRPRQARLPGQGGAVDYELVFGHRRHRACLELGLPLLAMVDDATDQELFEAMERENRHRKNLSAWEQGCMYQRAIDEGLYTSLRKLAEAIHVDVSLVSKSIALARLPAAVIDAFPSPLEIQFRWAQPLSEALQRDPDRVLARAQKLRTQAEPLGAAQVLEALTADDEPGNRSRGLPSGLSVRHDGRSVGRLTIDDKGRAVLRIDGGVLSAENAGAFVEHLERFLALSDKAGPPQ